MLNGLLVSIGQDANVSAAVYWGTNDMGASMAGWTYTNRFPGWSAVGPLSTTVTPGGTGARYYYRFFASNSLWFSWGTPAGTFSTTGAPSVNNASGATNIGPVSATLQGEVTGGNPSPFTWIYWGTVNRGTSKALWEREIAIGLVSNWTFNASIGGLTPGGTYYYTCYVSNSYGDAWATVSNFTCLGGASRTWDGGGANALASNPINWVGDAAPGPGDNIILNTTSHKGMTWDMNILLISWSQVGYLGTVTVSTVYGPAGFTNLNITGNCTLSNGMWTHAGPQSTEANRILAFIGGNLIVGTGAVIDVTGKGYLHGYGPGTGAGGGSHGGFGSSGGPCYGSIISPVNLGSGAGGNNSFGGGAILLRVSGSISNNGLICADGGKDSDGGQWRGAAGGSILLVAGTLSGGGTIRANGAKAGWPGYYPGGGGRIALIVTNAGANFSACTGLVSAYRGDQNIGAASAGTIYREKQGDVPGRGELLVYNNEGVYGCNTDLNGVESVTYEFSRIALTNAGAIGIGPDDTLIATNTVFTGGGVLGGIWIAGGTLRVPLVYSYSNFYIGISAAGSTFNPATSLTIGTNAGFYVNAPHEMTKNVSMIVEAGGTMTLSAPLTPLLDLRVGGGASVATATITTPQTVISNIVVLTNGLLAINRPCIVSNDVSLLGGGTLTHSGPQTSETNKLEITVKRNLVIATNAAIDVLGKGYGSGMGPGTGVSGWFGGSYGGRGWNSPGNCYGSITSPSNLGSGGTDGAAGGGAILLIVSGAVSNNGLICADARKDLDGGLYSGGSGGTIRMIAGTLTGGGTIRANGSLAAWGGGGFCPGGGGRIALVVTNAGANFSLYTGLINAFGGYGASGYGGAGTIFKKIASDRRGRGSALVDNPGAAASGLTDVPPSLPGNITNEVEFISFAITNSAKLRLTNDFMLGEIYLQSSSSALDLGSKTLTVRSKEHLLGPGSVLNYGAIVWWPYFPNGTIFRAK